VDELVKAVSSFRGKRVLVTGDTGFKGSWLALWLAEVGADVYGYALPPQRERDHFNLLGMRERIHHQDGDIRDLNSMAAFFEKAQPEVVFHLAAQALVRPSYDDPKETFDTNIGGSVNLLECVRETPSVKTLIYVTSDKCYRNKEWHRGYRESDELGGHDPYSASKAAAELVFSSYCDSFFNARENFACASVRAGNVIGGGDWSDNRIIPDCVRALQSNEPILLRNPTSTRPWQYVLEPLGGYLSLAAALGKDPKKYSGAWNFGPKLEASRTVMDLSEIFIKRWGSGKIQVQGLKNDPHEAGLLQLNCDKAHQVLGWKPCWDFERTVVETVDWYQAMLAGNTVSEVSAQQIKRYMEASHD
tara:strand:- start:1041 stop:2120 length:1080 start_codon:yes stop_codon:yes gene_type:complete